MKLTRFILFFAVLVSISCVTMNPLEPVKLKPDTSVLYVFREDSAVSMSDKVIVYLNNKKATEIIEYDGYKALILKPGTYTLKFVVFNKKNKKIKEQEYSDVIEPMKRAYMCAIAYNFGWRGWKKFFNAEGKSVSKRFKFKGKVDLTKRISPK